MANDINLAVSNQPIKNGTCVTTTSFTGKYNTNNNYVNNKPVIGDIENKYDNRFYNGIFVQLVDGQTIVGA